jgi:hypothetical protein
MNCLFGGTTIALVCVLRRKSSAFSARLASDLGRLLPSIFAFTITLGVAPLLFLQVMYGQFLYASSILIGVPWLAIIGFVILAYYGVYFFSMKGEHGATAVVLGLVLLLLASVAFIYSNNFTLMLSPQRWLDLYHNGANGWNLNWSEPSLLPRYLHFVLGALAISGLGLAVLGLRQQEDKYRGWLIEQGTSPKRQFVIGVSCGLLTVAVMIAMRDLLRTFALAPYFSPNQLAVAPQWSIIGLFVLLFVAGLATLFYMLRKVAIATRMQAAAAQKLP